MIIINQDSPRWMREMDRYRPLKHLLFIHGNILDQVAYQVQKKTTDSIYWSSSLVGDFLQRYLVDGDYQVVGEFDPTHGLKFAAPEMEKQFQQLSGEESERKAVVGPQALQDPEPVIRRMSQVLAQREIPAAFVIQFSSHLLAGPDRLAPAEQALFTRILKASLDSKEVIRAQHRWRNLLILICHKLNDLPTFLFLNNPRTHSIALERPDARERQRFFQSHYTAFYRAEGQITAETTALFTALTDGLTHYELFGLISLSQMDAIPPHRIKQLIERYKYGVVESAWDKLDHNHIQQAEISIRQRVKGQEAAIVRVIEIVKRARMGLVAGASGYHQRPRGVLFFAGPTGVGKTELAKALAELLFGEEDRLLRFDMSEYSAPHADQRLMGAPPGYVGYEEGGKLTNAVKAQPFSVALFDEIEKANPSIFDKFLQILDDGRLTDGKGDTVYFSETILVFTSNLGTVSNNLNSGEGRQLLVNPEMSYSDIRERILQAIRDYFNLTLGRPEILNRFGDNFVVFDFIRPPHDGAIIKHLVNQLCKMLQERYEIELKIADYVIEQLTIWVQPRLTHGGRGIRNMIDSALVNPLAAALFDNLPPRGSRMLLENIEDLGSNSLRRYQIKLVY